MPLIDCTAMESACPCNAFRKQLGQEGVGTVYLATQTTDKESVEGYLPMLIADPRYKSFAIKIMEHSPSIIDLLRCRRGASCSVPSEQASIVYVGPHGVSLY